MQPFQSTLWLLVGLSVHVVAVMLYLLDRFRYKKGVFVHMCVCIHSVCMFICTPQHCRSSLSVDEMADRGEDCLRPSHCSVPVLQSLAFFLSSDS